MIYRFNQFEDQNKIPLSIIYQIIASLAITLLALLAKLLKRVPSSQILIYRNVLHLVFNLLLTKILNDKSSSYYVEDKSMRFQVYLRAIIGSIDANIFFAAVLMVTLSEAILLTLTTPLWAALIMIYILKKQEPSKSLLISISASIIGICLVVKPTFLKNLLDDNNVISKVSNQDQSHHTLGVVLLIFEAILFAIQQIMMKDIGQNVSTGVLVNQLSICIILTSAIIQVMVGRQVILTVHEIYTIVLMGLLGFFFQTFISKAFQIGNVTQLSLIGNIEVVFSVIFDYIILDNELDTLGVLGIIIVLSSIIYITVSR